MNSNEHQDQYVMIRTFKNDHSTPKQHVISLTTSLCFTLSCLCHFVIGGIVTLVQAKQLLS